MADSPLGDLTEARKLRKNAFREMFAKFIQEVHLLTLINPPMIPSMF